MSTDVNKLQSLCQMPWSYDDEKRLTVHKETFAYNQSIGFVKMPEKLISKICQAPKLLFLIQLSRVFSFLFLPFFLCLLNCYKTYALFLKKNNTRRAEGSIHDQNVMAFIIFQFACKTDQELADGVFFHPFAFLLFNYSNLVYVLVL